MIITIEILKEYDLNKEDDVRSYLIDFIKQIELEEKRGVIYA